MSVNEKMTAIANAIRSKTGGKEALGLDAMAAAVSEVFEAGIAEKEKYVHFGSVKFNGERTITVPLPFIPDTLYILNFSALAFSTANTFCMTVFDRASFGKYGATFSMFNPGGTMSNASIGNANISTFFTVNANSVTFDPPSNSTYAPGAWKGEYMIVAVRSGKSDKELLQADIDALPSGGGSVTFSQARVLATVSESEWEDMIAPHRKGGWTFAFV